MKKLTVLCLAVFSCLALYAETLQIRVTDIDLGIPLEGATITVSGSDARIVTDAEGNATLNLPDGFHKGTITVRLPGYRAASAQVLEKQKKLSIGLSIADVVTGSELVVERAAPGKTDAKPGVSLVMDSREMSTTAEIGLIEDIMSSISTLPGVGFSGGWDAQPSIRGGYPDEMGTVLDGFYVLFPFHWGGAYSIFNPSMVESAKMSHGIFSARYGRAMSGLLEVTTIKPASKFRFDSSIGSTSFDFFAQVPITEKAGLFTGGKVTYLETLRLTGSSTLDSMTTMPFIRDFYLKAYVTPSPALDMTFNAFIGSDGVGTDEEETDNGFETKSVFDYTYYQGFVGANVRWMPTEKLLVHFIGAYNNNTIDLEYDAKRSGFHKYSDSFLDRYDGDGIVDTDGLNNSINGAYGYSLTDFGDEGKITTVNHQVQGKLDTDIQITKSDIITFGGEEVFQFSSVKEAQTGWTDIMDSGNTILYNYNYNLDAQGNRMLNTSGYALWNHGNDDSALQGELGLRCEHFYLWNDDLKLNMKPTLDPRLSVQWTPIRNTARFDKVTFTAGTGFFSSFPVDLIAADESLNINNSDVGANRAWFQVIGSEFDFQNDWIFKIEGYYKRYFNRLYVVGDQRQEPTDFSVNNDGIGNVYGFDLMLQKKNGRKIDGYLSYSFVYARYMNPTASQYDSQTTTSGDPLDQWYYPGFHRFHTLNLVLNWKPRTGMVLTVKSSIATGTPKPKAGTINAYAATLPDGTVMERYSRYDTYDDSLRTGISCPVDVRFGLSGYYSQTKIRWEYYIGAEDIFTNLYQAKTNKQFDPYTGDEIKDSDKADFGIGMPLVSVGYKISY